MTVARELARFKLDVCNILIEISIPMNLVRLVKMCLKETYSRVRVGKHLSGTFPFKNGLKQGDALSPLLFNFALEYAIRRVQLNPCNWIVPCTRSKVQRNCNVTRWRLPYQETEQASLLESCVA
jgi:hypothetical protein